MTKQIPRGYKQTKLGVIPEGWEVMTLGNLLKNKPKYGINAPAVDYNQSLPTYLRITDIDDNGRFITEKKTSVNDPDYANYVLKDNDMVFARTGATVGKSYLYNKADGELVFAGFLIKVTLNQNALNAIFFKSYVNSYQYWKWITLMSARSGQPGINAEEYCAMPLPLPTLQEQEKIAEILSTWDDVITKQEQLIEQKQVFKKGIMQQIFSQSLRFTDDNGNDYQAWETKKLGDVVNHFGGTSLEQYVDASGKYKFISIGNYSTTGHYIDNLQRINANDKSMSKILNANDLVMVLNDKTSTGDIIGSTILINEDNKFIYNQRSERLVCQHIAFPKFLWFYLNSTEFRSMVFNIAQGGTQIYINFPAVKKLTLNLPSLQEQAKIADFLTSIDDEIIKQTQILEQLKLQKQSLVQKLLTGQVRV